MAAMLLTRPNSVRTIASARTAAVGNAPIGVATEVNRAMLSAGVVSASEFLTISA